MIWLAAAGQDSKYGPQMSCCFTKNRLVEEKNCWAISSDSISKHAIYAHLRRSSIVSGRSNLPMPLKSPTTKSPSCRRLPLRSGAKTRHRQPLFQILRKSPKNNLQFVQFDTFGRQEPPSMSQSKDWTPCI